MRSRKFERWVDLLGELAWMGLLLGAAFVCPIPSARHLVEVGVMGWAGWRIVRWLPPSFRRRRTISPPVVKDPIAEINAIVEGLWRDPDTEKMGDV
ncbi:MAG: hypothetical protein U0822_02245 [Anaerolineae bacterium]